MSVGTGHTPHGTWCETHTRHHVDLVTQEAPQPCPHRTGVPVEHAHRHESVTHADQALLHPTCEMSPWPGQRRALPSLPPLSCGAHRDAETGVVRRDPPSPRASPAGRPEPPTPLTAASTARLAGRPGTVPRDKRCLSGAHCPVCLQFRWRKSPRVSLVSSEINCFLQKINNPDCVPWALFLHPRGNNV